MSAGTPAGGRPPRRKEEITCGDGRTLLWTCGCLVVAGDLLPGHAPADHRLRSPGRGLVPSPFPSTTRRRARGSKPGWVTTLDWRNSTRRPSPSPGPQQGASRAGEPVVMGLHVAAVRGVHGMDVVFFSGRSRVRFGLALGLSGLGGSANPAELFFSVPAVDDTIRLAALCGPDAAAPRFTPHWLSPIVFSQGRRGRSLGYMPG